MRLGHQHPRGPGSLPRLLDAVDRGGNSHLYRFHLTSPPSRVARCSRRKLPGRAAGVYADGARRDRGAGAGRDGARRGTGRRGGPRVDFYAVGPSMMARRRRAPLAFVVFDVPHLAGEPTIGLTYRDRRRLLELLELDGPAWCTRAVVRRGGRRGARGVRPVAARGPGRQAGRLPVRAGEALSALAEGEVRGLAGAPRAAASRAIAVGDGGVVQRVRRAPFVHPCPGYRRRAGRSLR